MTTTTIEPTGATSAATATPAPATPAATTINTIAATATATTTAAAVTLRDDERQRCEIWTRVMGYHRPVASFNIGKQGEFAERLYFEQPSAPAAEAGCGRSGH